MPDSETRPGWKTTEFWALIVINVLPEVGAIDVGNAKIKGLLHIVTIAAYAIARGLAKQGVPNEKPAVIVPVAPVDPTGVKASGLPS